MYKRFFLSFAVFLLLAALNLGAQDGYKGPGPSSNIVTVEQAKKLRDDTMVNLRGRIDRALGDDKYMFSDSTGSITIEVDDHLWFGLSVDEQDWLEITGDIDIEFGRVEIDVKSMKKV
jgi:uncharacterized protein (TIGR00156 family)